MEYLFIYLLQIFDYFEYITTGVWFFTLSLFLVYITLGFMTKFQHTKYDGGNYCDISQEAGVAASKFCQKWLPITITISLFFVLIPTKQTLLLLGGTYYGKKAYQRISTNNKIEKINTIIDLELDKIIKGYKYERRNDD